MNSIRFRIRESDKTYNLFYNFKRLIELGDVIDKAELSVISGGHYRQLIAHNSYYARGSMYETVTRLQIFGKLNWLKDDSYNLLYQEAEGITRCPQVSSTSSKTPAHPLCYELSAMRFYELLSVSKNGDIIMKRKMIVLLMLAALILIFIASQPLYAQEKMTTKKIYSAKESQNAYQIGSGDILEITTWKEPDFSRDAVLVRTDGKISFPLLDDLQAVGLTPLELKINIEKGLKSYVASPFVTVHVKDPQSKKFYILGEVRRTGQYPLVKRLTILQAFALAGGFTEWASKDEIILLRNENGQEKMYRINYKNIAKGKDIAQNVTLKADDTIIVP